MSENSEQLSAAQKARAESNRQRAKALKEARLVHTNITVAVENTKDVVVGGERLVDTGGGFLLDPRAQERPHTLAPPDAPLVHRSEQPHCTLCDHPFPQSYLFDTFDYSVCDQCRDDEEKHVLITRTEAKTEFLLKDCDLDLRPPALRCVKRRNPHRAHFAEMRLYLRAQVEERALQVWGSREALEAEHEARRDRSERGKHTAARRRLRALRMDVRSSVYDRTRDHHRHEYGAETYDADRDVYCRSCRCGHVQTYEKM